LPATQTSRGLFSAAIPMDLTPAMLHLLLSPHLQQKQKQKQEQKQQQQQQQEGRW
jgi:hypothetical protein